MSVSYFASGWFFFNYDDVKWVCADLFPEKIWFDRELIFIRDHTTSSRRHIVTSYRRWRRDASTRCDEPFVHANNSKYTTRDAYSLQRSGVNFHLFLALRHASRITTRKREVTKLLAFRQTEESLPTQLYFSNEFCDNMFLIITNQLRCSTVAKWRIHLR